MDLHDLRNEYLKNVLDEASCDKSPFKQFDKWFKESQNAELLEPNAMILGTVNEEGIPTQRTVLLKKFDKKGLVFFTNYGSRKSKDLEKNGSASVLFPWYGLERQVNIVGSATKVSQKESIEYFLSRPFGSQMGAWVSNQSKIISNRSILESKLQEMKNKFREGKVPVPDFWGGYRINPVSFEFWQGRKNRLHDRIFYQREGESWTISRLAP